MKITPELVKAHQLTEEEYQRILEILGREPTLTELGIFSVMWSEHCSYKSSRLHLRKLPTRGPRILQGPGENAGVVDIGNGYAVVFKIESHNHPSFIEPFQGAATGVGGILRDIFTMGARPIAVMDALRFGPLDDPQVGVRNRRILEGVVSGIAHYGNCFGVPTVGGETVFEPCYNGNPLVNVFALGVARHEEIFYARACGVGNPVIYVGAKTGRDGIHGASMASAEFSDDASQKRPNVQVGDPFLEKLLLEACLEAMKTGAVVGIQDMGAAGLTCSTCEMGSRAGTGIEIELSRVPQRELGMTPYEIMLSESQERMLLVVQQGREEEVLRIFRKWGLDAVIIGRVTADGKLRVKNRGEVVAEIPARALADEAPVYDRPYTEPFREAPIKPPSFASEDIEADLVAVITSQNLCSKRWIWEQYDYMVRTNTIVGPGADAAVLRIKEAGVAVAMSLDGNERYCYLDPYLGTQLIVAECCRNLSTVGATPIAATNNLNFGNPERPEIMAQLVRSIEGLAEACRFFETPITGGNVSLYNETLGRAIYPSPVVGIVGLLPVRVPPPLEFPEAGLQLILLGGLGNPELVRFGGTEYAKVVLGEIWGLPPALDMDYEKRVQAVTREVVNLGLVRSAHDLSRGGLGAALARCSFGPNAVGARVELPRADRLELLLFHEAPSRVLVSTSDPQPVMEIARRYGVEATRIGFTQDRWLEVLHDGQLVVRLDVEWLRQEWEMALPRMLGAAVICSRAS